MPVPSQRCVRSDVAERVGTAGDDHDDNRSACLEQLIDEVGLHAGQPKVFYVAALAGRALAEQSGEVADQRDAQVGVPCGVERGREACPVVALHRAAPLVGDLDVREFGS